MSTKNFEPSPEREKTSTELPGAMAMAEPMVSVRPGPSVRGLFTPRRKRSKVRAWSAGSMSFAASRRGRIRTRLHREVPMICAAIPAPVALCPGGEFGVVLRGQHDDLRCCPADRVTDDAEHSQWGRGKFLPHERMEQLCGADRSWETRCDGFIGGRNPGFPNAAPQRVIDPGLDSGDLQQIIGAARCGESWSDDGEQSGQDAAPDRPAAAP